MKRILMIALTALAVCSCYPKIKFDPTPWYFDPNDVDNREPLKVMSFNIRYKAEEDTGIKNWENRKAGIFEMFNSIRPLVVGMQECDTDQLDDIISGVSGYKMLPGEWSGKNGNSTGAYDAIMYLKDSIAFENEGTYWLTETPEERSVLPGCVSCRIAHWAVLRKIKGGQRFLFVATHLENGNQLKQDNLRYFEMQVIKSKMPEINPENLPWIMVADWNTAENDVIFDDMVAEYGMKSARATARLSDNSRTYNNYGTTSTSQWDHIFYSGFPAVSKFATVTQKWAGYVYISDHYPVYAILRFEK